MHILTDRGIDLDAYLPYLASIRDRLPSHVAAFASNPKHYSLDDRESLHDASLESVVVRESAPGSQASTRGCEIEVHLLGAFHDRRHVLRYTGVRGYELHAVGIEYGHGNVITHEVRLTARREPLVHEIAFDSVKAGRHARMLIECSSFTHDMASINERLANER
jgi:hypothetical protein